MGYVEHFPLETFLLITQDKSLLLNKTRQASVHTFKDTLTKQVKRYGPNQGQIGSYQFSNSDSQDVSI